MSNEFRGTGNLGSEVEVRDVTVNNEQRKVCLLYTSRCV